MLINNSTSTEKIDTSLHICHSLISSPATKNIDNRKISREDQYQPAQSDRTLCWLPCRRPVVEVQQTGHVYLSFIYLIFDRSTTSRLLT